MAIRTTDARTTDRSVDVLTVVRIGRTQELTPEGFLLCRDVPIARLGEMLYLPAEIGNAVKGGPDGIARVTRDEAELFRPETIASVLGKAVVDDHPAEDVNPTNWKELAGGTVLNPHRGDGVDSDLLLADLLIKDAEAIAAVQAGKREVSCGYECDYADDGNGRGRQLNIIFNHVALVKSGRCGTRCSIGDTEMKTRDQKPTLKERLLAAFGAKDQAAFDAALEAVAEDEVGTATKDAATKDCDGETKDAEAPPWFTAYTKTTDERMDGFEAAIAKLTGTKDAAAEDPDKDKEAGATSDAASGAEAAATADAAAAAAKAEKDKDERTDDSAGLADEFQDVITRAEILSPGIKFGTYDAAASRTVTTDRMCALRRRALVAALEGDHADFVTAVAAGADVATMTCDAVTPAFIAASELAKRANGAPRPGLVKDSQSRTAPPALAEINAANRAFWSDQSN